MLKFKYSTIVACKRWLAYTMCIFFRNRKLFLRRSINDILGPHIVADDLAQYCLINTLLTHMN